MTRVLQFLESRTGLVSRWEARLGARVPGLSLGRALLPAIAAVFALTTATGIALSLHYAPTTTDAWASVWRIQNTLPLGALLRGIHHLSVGALLVLVGLAVAHGLVTAAYRAPRELGWFGLLGLLAVLPGFPMTGNLLPWDESGYWQAQVEASVAGGLPVIGTFAKTALLGGAEIANPTLTRYAALHTLVLPAAFLALLALAWSARRVTPEGPPVTTGVAYFPRQYFLELGLAVAVLAILVALGAALPAPLDAPADALRAVDARPEWYFLPLFALRKAFEGPYEVIATAVIPGAIGGLLAVLPFVDRTGQRRWYFGGAVALIVVGLGALAGLSARADQGNEALLKDQAAVALRAQLASAYAAVPGSQPGADGRIPLFEGYGRFLHEGCAECHASQAGAPDAPKGPDLRGYQTRAWLRSFLNDPNTPEHFGRTKLKHDEALGVGMPAYASLGDGKLTALVEFLFELSGRSGVDAGKATQGKALFESEGCSGCHDMAGGAMMGPHLQGHGSTPWIASVIADPNHEALYGTNGSDMPDFAHISREDREGIAAWLLHQGTSPLPSE